MTEDGCNELEFTVPPDFLFHICIDGTPRAQVYGPKSKRNWVLWTLSQHALALVGEGVVSVRRLINGEWRECDDWRNLAH